MTVEDYNLSTQLIESRTAPRKSARVHSRRLKQRRDDISKLDGKGSNAAERVRPRKRIVIRESQYFTKSDDANIKQEVEDRPPIKAAKTGRRRSDRLANSCILSDAKMEDVSLEGFANRITAKSQRDTSRHRYQKTLPGQREAPCKNVMEDKPKLDGSDQRSVQKRRRVTKKSSPYFTNADIDKSSVGTKLQRKRKKVTRCDAPVDVGSTETLNRQPISEHTFGLLQEVYAPDPLRVLIVAMFCNQTPGHRARPFIARLFEQYPDVEALSQADPEALAQEIRPLGLFNIRARRLIQLAKEWLVAPPIPGKTSKRKGLARKIGYPDTEVSHLPGCGPYAMDCYRLFCAGESWRSVRPDDKELRPYVQWKWSKEGVDYRKLLSDDPGVR